MAGTCNAELLTEVSYWKLQRDQFVAGGASPEAVAEHNRREVRVFVTYAGPPEALEDSPLRVGHHDGAVARGWLRVADVERFREMPGVVRINLAARIAAHIDRSMADIKVDAVRSKAPPYTSTSGVKAYTGKGVLVGIIDDAIYERHPSFLIPGGAAPLRKTRIVALWDQRPVTASQGLPPQGFGYGTLWDEQAINNVLAAGTAGIGKIAVSSPDDHGSHVTGIAAGNGALQDGKAALFTLVGAAPEADIAFCNGAQFDATGAAAADAMNFIFDLAERRHQPCVINMSFGTHEGARDGSSDLEQAIDRALLDAHGRPRPGRAVVVAAGNEAAMKRHSRKLIYANGRLSFGLKVEEFTYPNGLKVVPKIAGHPVLGWDRLYVWYADAASLEVLVVPPSGVPDPPGWVTFDDIKVSPRVGVVSGVPTPSNGKKYIVLTFWAPMANGEWRLEFRETAGRDTPIDIWVDRINDLYVYPRFIDRDDVIDNTITCPATAKNAIAVGGYVSTPGPNETYSELYSHSSRGLDSVYQVSADQTRPHVVAPARRIVSANNSWHADEKAAVDIISARFGGPLTLHALMTGTSQAAPHVTGVIALMFQKNPALTAPQIRSILTATANRAQIPIRGFPNRHWGYGRIDARAALAAVP